MFTSRLGEDLVFISLNSLLSKIMIFFLEFEIFFLEFEFLNSYLHEQTPCS